MAAEGTAGGPTGARAMKGGISITNHTQFLNRGGQVYTLSCDQRVTLSKPIAGFGEYDFNELFARLAGHPKTRSSEGSQFSKTTCLYNHVVDSIKYEEFGGFNGTLTADAFWEHIATWPTALACSESHGLRTRPMSTTFILFEPPASAQTYTITGHGFWYTRWPVDSIPGQAQLKIPTVPGHVLGKALTDGEKSSHKGEIISE
jgi:hypothetical protein